MPRIDLYINSLSKFGATSVVLRSGENVVLRFPTGDRFATQVIRHAQLVEVVREVMPAQTIEALRRGEPGETHHDAGGSRYEIAVRPKSAESWEVEITPGAAVADWPFDDLPGEEPPGAPEVAAESRGPEPPGTPGPQASASPPEAPRAGSPPEAPAAEPPRSPQAPPAREPARPSPLANVAEGGGSDRVHDLLARLAEMEASDLHLSTGAPPHVRLHGRMQALSGLPAYGGEDLLKQLLEIAPEKNRVEFEEKNDTDFAYAIPGTARFRVNMFRDRRGPGAVMRAIPYEILSPEQIGLPKKVLDLCYLSKGLVLVTGPTGSGKSTTLATLIDHINEHREDHIISIEDPIEFVHENKQCLVNQREVHEHTSSFKGALRAALREDPDVVLVGEMRDLETIAIAVETAETGHLVFGTLHTSTAPSTIDRVIDQFPPDQQEQIRQMLSESLKGVIAQTLLRKKGGGRVAAYEILVGTSAVSNLIREGKTFQLFSLMQTGRSQGMVTLGDSLLHLVKAGVVEPAEAYVKAVNKTELENLFRREGIEIPTRAE